MDSRLLAVLEQITEEGEQRPCWTAAGMWKRSAIFPGKVHCRPGKMLHNGRWCPARNQV